MQIVMNTVDAIKAFKSKAGVAEAIGISKQAVSQWGEVVPESSALKLLLVAPKIKHKKIQHKVN